MTRTARASFPRALNRDRSESKTGMGKAIQKNGAGHHNWGDLFNEHQLELSAMEDEDRELAEAEEFESSDTSSALSEPLEGKEAGLQRTSSAVSNEELEAARRFRKKALKRPELDLSAIARTSSAVAIHRTDAVVVTSDAQTSTVP